MFSVLFRFDNAGRVTMNAFRCGAAGEVGMHGSRKQDRDVAAVMLDQAPRDEKLYRAAPAR